MKSVRLSDELAETIDAWSSEVGVSREWIVNKLLEEAVPKLLPPAEIVLWAAK